MPIAPRSSLAVGLEALRANPLRTVLSTLGVVMGVGAMVSVLSMGDGVGPRISTALPRAFSTCFTQCSAKNLIFSGFGPRKM